jgi:hypothetical protein
MDVSHLLIELYGRIPPLADDVVSGLEPEELVAAPAPGANPIAWLIWHLARIQDHHIAQILEAEQIWVTGDWARHFGLAPDPQNTGYSHDPHEVRVVRPDRPEVLSDYLHAVARRTREMLSGLTPADLDRIVDRRWDPPVTLGVRLVSVADDSLQHVGQAAYAKGLLQRR